MYTPTTKLAKSTAVNNPVIMLEAHGCKPSVTMLASFPYIAMTVTAMLAVSLGMAV